MDLNNIVGFKAVDKNGNERQVTVDEMTELVSARIVSAASEISTFAAAAAAGTDEFEDPVAPVRHLLLASYFGRFQEPNFNIFFGCRESPEK